MPTEACFVNSEVLADGLEWDQGWDGSMVFIKGQRSSKSTVGANKSIIKFDVNL